MFRSKFFMKQEKLGSTWRPGFSQSLLGRPLDRSQRDKARDMVATSGMEILSSEPVIVAQLMHGYEDQADNRGDPSMVLVTPEEHAVADASFAVHGLAANGGTYINVVIPTAAVNSVMLDGVAVDPALFSAMGSYGFSGAAIAVTPGPHRLRGSAPFTAMVYGYGTDAVSYAYPAASSLAVTAP